MEKTLGIIIIMAIVLLIKKIIV